MYIVSSVLRLPKVNSAVCFLKFFVSSLLTHSRTKRSQAAQELKDREEVERELSVVKAWIQETRELLFNPTPDIDSLLQELEVRRKVDLQKCTFDAFKNIW